jgi:hypothetical protein
MSGHVATPKLFRSLVHALSFKDREDLWKYAFSKKNMVGTIAEFGVWKGESINYLAKLTNETIFGFDSFEGLQEDWRGKATVGFEKLGEATGTQPKSLIRMFGPRGNPQARNLFGIIGYLQKQAGVELHVRQRGQGNQICERGLVPYE